MNQTSFVLIKLVLLFIALGLASFLSFGEGGKDVAIDQNVIFVLDINRSMNTEDVLSGGQKISRLQAARSIIQKTIIANPQFSYGLILFNASTDYILPPSFDSWTFLLYLSGITTNLLPDWVKNFAQLSWLLRDSNFVSYLIISDFDRGQKGINQQRTIHFPRWTALLGLWSLAGDAVRYSNGILYYDNGNSVFSARNDQFATSLNLPYTVLTSTDNFTLQQLLFHGVTLPLAQRIFLYTILWILVILVVLL